MTFNNDDWTPDPINLLEIGLGIFLVGVFLVLFWLMQVLTSAQTLLPAVPIPSVAFGMPGLTSPSGMQTDPWRPHDPQHREPPAGWQCSNDKRAPKDHQCDCRHECKDNEPTVSCDETGENCVTTPAVPGKHVVENAKCSVYCHPKSCACDVVGCGAT